MKKANQPKVGKIDIGAKKKERTSLRPAMGVILVLFLVGYVLWTQPVGLQLRDAMEDLTRPVKQVIHNLLTVD